MKSTFTLRRCLTSIALGATLSLAAAIPAQAGFALGFVQNETPGAAPNGDYNIDYGDYTLHPEKFLAFGPKVNLGGSSTLTFKAFLGDEFGAGTDPAMYDQFSVWASTDGSSIGYNLLASSAPTLGGESIAEWGGTPGHVDVTVDLTGYANQVIYLAFSFDPLDDVNNDFPGVRIDDILVTDANSTLYSENFESGTAAGWQLNGLWHVTENFAAVPEPSTLWLLAACTVGFAVTRRRRPQRS